MHGNQPDYLAGSSCPKENIDMHFFAYRGGGAETGNIFAAKAARGFRNNLNFFEISNGIKLTYTGKKLKK